MTPRHSIIVKLLHWFHAVKNTSHQCKNGMSSYRYLITTLVMYRYNDGTPVQRWRGIEKEIRQKTYEFFLNETDRYIDVSLLTRCYSNITPYDDFTRLVSHHDVTMLSRRAVTTMPSLHNDVTPSMSPSKHVVDGSWPRPPLMTSFAPIMASSSHANAHFKRLVSTFFWSKSNTFSMEFRMQIQSFPCISYYFRHLSTISVYIIYIYVYVYKSWRDSLSNIQVKCFVKN